jgi:hypothetical protein
MPNIRLLLSSVAISGVVSSASATVTLQMSLTGTGNIASNFANAAGAVTDGMNWGIVVDTGSTAGVFSQGSYTPFDISTAGFLSTASGVTDDYYVPASATTTDSSTFSEVGGTPGGHGTITQINNAPYGGSTGISVNQKFGLIWFSTNTALTVGNKYGFFTDSTLTIPSDGGVAADRSAAFAGVDPTRFADLSIVAVPEPSMLGLMCVGVLGLGFRRLRSR